MLFALVKWLRGSLSVPRRRDLAALTGLALMGCVVNQILFLEGVQRTTTVHANILITCIPVFTLAVALLLERERATIPKVGGVLVAGSGAAWLALSRGGPSEGATVLGDVLVGLNTICYAGYLVLSKDMLRRYEPLTVVTYVFLIGAVLIAPVGAPALLHVDGGRLTTKVVLVCAYIIVFPSFLTYLLSIWSLGKVTSSLVAMYVYIQPVVTAFLSPVILGEKVTSRSGLAALVIFVGLALATWGEQLTGRQLGAAYRAPAEGA